MPRVRPNSNDRANASVLAILALACAVAVSFVVMGFSRRAEGSSPTFSLTPAVSATDPMPEPAAATRSALTQPPIVLDSIEDPPASPRRGIQGFVVGEHPNLPPSPIATADVVVEPSQDFRRTIVPGTPIACDRFRELIRNTGTWDPDIVLAFIWRESLCNERAVSSTNDWGLLQINATCWAGKGRDGLRRVRHLPPEIGAIDLRCDGATQSTPAAKLCFHAKEQFSQTGQRPKSPCDDWLDPAVNLRAAYEIWSLRGWQPWCFDDISQDTAACEAAIS